MLDTDALQDVPLRLPSSLHVKLNELLGSQQGASNGLIDVESRTEDGISQLHDRFTILARRLEEDADPGQAHSVAEAVELVEDQRKP